MRNEFLFRFPRGKLIGLIELERQMNNRMRSQFQDDMDFMDRRMVEVFDNRQNDEKSKPPLKSIGRMPVSTALQKFK